MMDGPTATHPLFPADQAILWLPGFPGDRKAFCTYNRNPAGNAPRGRRKASPPFPVSPVNYVAWDANADPPFPYHPIPIARLLTLADMNKLSLRVLQLAGACESEIGNPLRILRNDKKCLILLALAEMRCLSGFVPPPHVDLAVREPMVEA